MTDDDGTDLAAGGTVRGISDLDNNGRQLNDSLANQLQNLGFDHPRINIWAVGAERRGQTSSDDFNTSSGDIAGVGMNSLGSATPVTIGSLTCHVDIDDLSKGKMTSASAPESMPGIDIHSIWETRNPNRQCWATDRLFDSDDQGKRDEAQDEIGASAAKIGDSGRAVWEWEYSLNVSLYIYLVWFRIHLMECSLENHRTHCRSARLQPVLCNNLRFLTPGHRKRMLLLIISLWRPKSV